MKKVCVILFAVMMLAGCAKEEKKVICTETYNNDEYVYEFNARGDTIYSHNIDLKISLSDLGLEEDDSAEENIENKKALLDAVCLSGFQNIKGVSVESKIDDAKEYYIASIKIDDVNEYYIAAIKIDFDKADFSQLISAGFLGSGTTDISLEQTLSEYSGCVEQ